jgi:hypothetical protein
MPSDLGWGWVAVVKAYAALTLHDQRERQEHRDQQAVIQVVVEQSAPAPFRRLHPPSMDQIRGDRGNEERIGQVPE